jgi:hypothetical protein
VKSAIKIVYDLRILDAKMHGMARYGLELLQAMLQENREIQIGALIKGAQVEPRLPKDERLTLWPCALPPTAPNPRWPCPSF